MVCPRGTQEPSEAGSPPAGESRQPPGRNVKPHVLEEEESAQDRGGRAASLEKGL